MAKKDNGAPQYRYFTIGHNRGKQRIWFNSKVWLPAAGFVRGAKFKADIQPDHVVLRLAKDGDRTVSGKRTADGTWMPVIDINTKELQFSRKDLQVRVQHGCLTITVKK